MKRIELTQPDGKPYLSLRQDDRFAFIQIHDYDYLGGPFEFKFDRRAIPMLIDALTELKQDGN